MPGRRSGRIEMGSRLRASLRGASGERSQALPFIAMLLMMFIAAIGLAIDLGLIFFTKSDVTRAVDAAALAGAAALPDQDLARARVDEYLALNDVDPATAEVTFPTGEGGEPRKLVEVKATKTANLIILDAFGLDDVTVESDGRAEQASVDAVLIFDRSGSMCRDSHGLRVDCPSANPYPPGQWQPMLHLKEAANIFVESFDPVYDQIALASYSTSGTLDQELTQGFDDVQTAIDEMWPSGYTNIYEGTMRGVEELINFPPDGNARSDSVGVMILLTDGEANRPSHSGCSDTNCPYARLKARLAAQEACYRHIVVYTILMGEEALQNNENVELMQDIADVTDEGQDCPFATESSYPSDGHWGDGATENYFEAPSPEDLQDVFEDIAQRIFTRLDR